MRTIVTNMPDMIGPWVCSRVGGQWRSGRGQALGLVETTSEGFRIIGGVLYEDYNGSNIFMHVAGEGSRWLTREFLWMAFDYPFTQLNCHRVSGVVPESNLSARRFDEALGFEAEATLKEAYRGEDLIVYRMFRHQCRWLSLKEPRKCKKDRLPQAQAGSHQSVDLAPEVQPVILLPAAIGVN